MDNRATLLSALQWYEDSGVTCPVSAQPNNRFRRHIETPATGSPVTAPVSRNAPDTQKVPLMAHDEAVIQAQKAAMACNNPDELKNAVAAFDAHPLKKTATNTVFAAGNPHARVMVIGDPPAADEDRTGKAFVGDSGRLADNIFAAIGLSRDSDEADKSVYMTHILNWRPPGNRTPTPEEITINLPFIKRHIDLISPELIVIFGGLAAKALLNTNESISRIRGKFHEYGDNKIPALPTYSPEFLLANPAQKRKVWHDILAFEDRMNA